MSQNTTILISSRKWTLLTDNDVNQITFKILNATQPVLLKGTAGAVAPTTLTGSIYYEKGHGEIAVSLDALFTGVSGVSRVYAYCENDAEVFVSNGSQTQIVRIPTLSSNITTKFRDSFESYAPNGIYAEVKAAGDIIQTDGNVVASSWLDFSLDPLAAGTESSITTQATFQMPIEVAVGLSMSQRAVGQEFSVEIVSDEDPLPAIADLPIASISQAATVVTIDFAEPHGLTPGMSFGIRDVADSRLNYAALVVASMPSPTQITASAGPNGNNPSVTAGPFTSGFVYLRSRLGYARDGVSQIFENATATNSSFYFRSASGDALPSGTVTTNHSVTIGTTASVQAINALGSYSFQPTNEFRFVLQADRVQLSDSLIDTAAQSTARVTRTQVVPSPDKNYRLRIRGTKVKSSSVPTAQIVSVSKSGTTTATIVLDRPHNLTTSDFVQLVGPANATNFASILTPVAVSAVIDPVTIQAVWGTAATATSYGGYVAKVSGGLGVYGGAAPAIQTVEVITLSSGAKVLRAVFSVTMATSASIGDYINLVGVRNVVDGASLSLDGVYRVRNISTVTVDLEPIAGTVLPGTLVLTNAGGALIKRTSLRLHYLRIFDYERERVEVLPRPAGDLANALPVVLQGGTTAVTGTVTATVASTTVAGTVAVDAAIGAPVTAGMRASNANIAAMSAAGDNVAWLGTMIGAGVVKPYCLPEAEWNASLALTTTTAAAIQAAAGAGLKRHITSGWAINTGGALVELILLDGVTERARYPLPVNVPVQIDFPTGLVVTANTALNANLSAAGTVRFVATGYTAP